MRISRDEAQELVASDNFGKIDDKQLLSILSEYWHYDNENDIRDDINSGELPSLPDEVIREMAETQNPLSPDRNRFKALIMDWLVFKLNRVKNAYLEDRIKSSGKTVEIHGDPAPTGICPCCLHYSIGHGDDGLWDICPVCFWENGGDGPNRMSLKEAQKNFEAIGAIDKCALQYVDPEGPTKYKRNC